MKNEDFSHVKRDYDPRIYDEAISQSTQRIDASDLNKSLSLLLAEKLASADADGELEKIKSIRSFRTQIIVIRYVFLVYLIAMMTAETVGLYVIITNTALKVYEIDDSTLQILVGATIAQISAMIVVIVRSVYSDKLLEYFKPEKLLDKILTKA